MHQDTWQHKVSEIQHRAQWEGRGSPWLARLHSNTWWMQMSAGATAHPQERSTRAAAPLCEHWHRDGCWLCPWDAPCLSSVLWWPHRRHKNHFHIPIATAVNTGWGESLWASPRNQNVRALHWQSQKCAEMLSEFMSRKWNWIDAKFLYDICLFTVSNYFVIL